MNPAAVALGASPPEPGELPAPDALDAPLPLEAHSAYRADDWTPQRLLFHQNLESFAERVGLLVGLQSNGKVTQEEAFAEIRRMWKELKGSKTHLLNHRQS